MANQGRQDNPHQPTGTSGRKGGDVNPGINDENDARRGDPATTNRGRNTFDEDEDSGLGNRTTNR
jgi:hypothetical protein